LLNNKDQDNDNVNKGNYALLKYFEVKGEDKSAIDYICCRSFDLPVF